METTVTNESDLETKKGLNKLPSTTIQLKKDDKKKIEDKSNSEVALEYEDTFESRNGKEYNKKVRTIAMMEGKSKYNISEDLNRRKADITFSQLLDICPKLRAQLSKAIKLKNITTTEDTFEKVVLSTIQGKI